MNILRTALSGSRVRYTKDGYDLDLTYITERIIAMGYPATGMEKTYRNDIDHVSSFLNQTHMGKYIVFNLSERKYDNSKFMYRVEECGFPDHHPPPIQILVDIINKMKEWYFQGTENIIVVHCLAGKGRTGVIISAFMIYMGYYGEIFGLNDEQVRAIVQLSIREFLQIRGQGVHFPSQTRYLYYFTKILSTVNCMRKIPQVPSSPSLMLNRIVIHGIPDGDSKGSFTPYLQIMPAPSQFQKPPVIYNSGWERLQKHTNRYSKKIVYSEIHCKLQDDICVQLHQGNTLGTSSSQMCHFTFHTSYLEIQNNMCTFTKMDIDDAVANKKFPDEFRIEFYFETEHSLTKNINFKDVDGKTRANESFQSVQVNFSHTGWLLKQGGLVKNWKKRWFVARDGCLSYFQSESHPVPLGCIDLKGAGIEMCTPSEVSTFSKPYHFFKVAPPAHSNKSRTYYFGATAESEMRLWIKALTNQSIRYEPVKPTLPFRRNSTNSSTGSSRNLANLEMTTPAPKVTRGRSADDTDYYNFLT